MMLTEPASNSMVDYRALATIVAGGLIASTFFTLWVVPLAYTVFDDLAHMLTRRFRWWLRKPGAAAITGQDSAGVLAHGTAAAPTGVRR